MLTMISITIVTKSFRNFTDTRGNNLRACAEEPTDCQMLQKVICVGHHLFSTAVTSGGSGKSFRDQRCNGVWHMCFMSILQRFFSDVALTGLSSSFSSVIVHVLDANAQCNENPCESPLVRRSPAQIITPTMWHTLEVQALRSRARSGRLSDARCQNLVPRRANRQ